MNTHQINESVNTQILLSEVAVKLANSTEFDSIYKYVGEKIFEITPNSIVLICGFNHKEKYLQINYTYGLSNMLESVSEILGFNILDFKLYISDISTENLVAYKSQSIVNIKEGIYELTNKKINKTICNSVEKLLGVKKVSVMGFTWEDKLYGGLLLIQKEENENNIQLIETVINQSANTLQRITVHNKLIKNELLYRTLIDTSPDAISLSDMNGNLLNINQKAIEYFGPQSIKEREEFSKRQRNIIEFIDSSDREKLIENMKKKNAGVKYSAASYKCLRYNGTSFYAEINSTLLKDSIDKPYAMISVIRDVTERMQIEDALRESEEQFRAVSEYSFNSICIINELGKIIWANNAMIKMGGFPIEMIYGADSFTAFIAPESLEFVVSNFMKFVKGEEYEHHYEFYFIRADGEKRLCEKHMSHFKDRNGKMNLVISMMDVTERKNAENSKKKNEERYKTVFENSGEGIGYVNQNEEFVFANKAAEEIFGVESNGLVGKNLVNFLSQSDYDNIIKQTQKRKKGEKSVYEIVIIRPDKEKRNIILTSVSYFDENKNFVGSYGVFRDITERKNAEESLAINNMMLLKLNNFSIELTNLPYEENLEVFISKSVKDITGATVAVFSEYNAVSKTMATKHVELESKILEKVVSLLGKQITKVQSPVSDEMYNEMITETIGVRKTLYEATFGAISHTVGKAIQTLLNVDRFIGIAYIIDGKLYGTTLLAMKKDKPDLKKEYFENFMYLASMALRRRNAERELKEKMNDLQRFQNLTVGRELTMIDLKKEVNNLLKQNGQEEKYKIVE